MTGIDQALEEFMDEWSAGRRPDVADFLARAPEGERDTLARAIELFLDVAPTPDYDDATRAEIKADPILVAALQAGHEADAQPWAARLRAEREHAGLAVAQLAERVAEAVGRPDDSARIAGYLEDAERQDLDERRVSRRLVDALASALETTRARLAPSWGGPSAAVMYARSTDGPLEERLRQGFDLIGRAASAPAPEPLDEVDRLFLGGPDG